MIDRKRLGFCPSWFSYTLFALVGCGLLDFKNESEPSIIGEWRSIYVNTYTLEDSLGRKNH
jgi:hypothetical protein